MNWLNTTSKKQTLNDIFYFWGFWIVLCGIMVGIFEKSILSPIQTIVAFLLPQILPVYVVSLLFDNLFMRKKIILFFIISFPFCYFSGLLINQWFHLVTPSSQLHINNEFILFVFAAMFIGFRYVRVAISQKILLKEAENKHVLAELQYLRSQLNPHFLFNALNSIYSLILSQSDKAGEAVLTLSELMRYHVDLSGKQIIELSDEITLIERYIALEKLKLDKRCQIQFSVTGNAGSIKIAPLILIPFVENAFKHGITLIPKNNFVHVNIAVQANSIEFSVKNSIAENKAIPNNTKTKIGIENTIKRLELIYRDNFIFESKVDDAIYSVYLKINLPTNAH